jgi:hypothetical protein
MTMKSPSRNQALTVSATSGIDAGRVDGTGSDAESAIAASIGTGGKSVICPTVLLTGLRARRKADLITGGQMTYEEAVAWTVITLLTLAATWVWWWKSK